MFNAYLTSNFFLQKKFYIFSSPLLHNGFQISYSLSFSPLDTLTPPQCPYMSPFLSKSPNAKFNATSAGGVCNWPRSVYVPQIARLLNLSVSLEVSNCQIQRHFGWWYCMAAVDVCSPIARLLLNY